MVRRIRLERSFAPGTTNHSDPCTDRPSIAMCRPPGSITEIQPRALLLRLVGRLDLFEIFGEGPHQRVVEWAHPGPDRLFGCHEIGGRLLLPGCRRKPDLQAWIAEENVSLTETAATLERFRRPLERILEETPPLPGNDPYELSGISLPGGLLS